MAIKHFLQFSDFTLDEFEHVIERTRVIKQRSNCVLNFTTGGAPTVLWRSDAFSCTICESSWSMEVTSLMWRLSAALLPDLRDQTRRISDARPSSGVPPSS